MAQSVPSGTFQWRLINWNKGEHLNQLEIGRVWAEIYHVPGAVLCMENTKSKEILIPVERER